MAEYIAEDLYDECGSLVGVQDNGELTRCKECKYDHTCTHEMVRKLPGGSLIYCPVEYCSEGKRKEE